MKYGVIQMQNVIRFQHGCLSRHVATIPLTDQVNGKIVWQGEVEIFDLQSHPSAKRCYVFAYRDNDNKEHLTGVLQDSRVDSPRSAVRQGLLVHVEISTARNVGTPPNTEPTRAECHVSGKLAPVARLSKDIVVELQKHTTDY